MTVAAAMHTLKLRPGSSVVIADTLANIQKNLDALQGVAGKIAGLSTTDSTQSLSVSAAQYQKDSAILAKWGAGDGNVVEVTGVSASGAQAFVAAKASWVNTITVTDSSSGIQKNLDSLQSLVSDGSVRQITHTGASTLLKISAAQLVADADALAAIKNQAYTLAITNASVSDTLGLDGQSALISNAKIKAIDVKDSTDAIENNLDSLQRVGLRLKSITQTDADTPLTVTATQYAKDAVTIGKILTSYHLDVIRASAAQAAKLVSNQKVVTISVADTAANIAKKWSLMQRLSDSLTAIEVSDSANAISISGDQLAQSESLLAKFSDDADHTFKLAVNGVKAGQAASVANVAHVSAVNVSDSADNVVANLDDLQAVDAGGLLKSITLTGKKLSLSLDASRLQGDQAAATQGVLDKITIRHYGLAVSGATMGALGDLAANAHVVAVEVSGSSDEIESNLDTLFNLGRRLTRIQQSDSGTAIDVTQAGFESRAAVLAKVDGGYRVNITGASASKAIADALNGHVAKVSVADSGKNLAAHWSALRTMGATLEVVSKTDVGSLALSASGYLAGQNDGLLGKFDSELKFSLHGASIVQAKQLGLDDAVDKLDVTDDGSAVAEQLTDLTDLQAGGKLNSIVLNNAATRVSLHASQLDAAQGVLDLIRGGRYSLAVDQVNVADAKDLLAANGKIASLKVIGDAAGISENLADLAAAGHRLASIVRTDTADSALTLRGVEYEHHLSTLAKIVGGYQADLSDVSALKAGSFAAAAQVKSLQVSDTGARLTSAWNTLGSLGAKLTAVEQSDSALLQLTATQWSASNGLGDKFTTVLGLSISGASVSDLSTLDADTAVQAIQVSDLADSVADAWSDLAAASKLTQIRLTDPTTAMAMTAATYGASADLFALIQNGQYAVALSDVGVADAATLDADAHVSALDVAGSSEDIAASFDDLAALGKLGSITLSDDNGILALGTAQILGGADTFAKISNPYRIAATGVALADLADIQAVEDVATIAISDSAAHIADNWDELGALDTSLSGIVFTDDTPVLALSQPDWTAGADTLAKIGGSYAVELSSVEAGSAEALAAETAVSQLSVSDSADNVASNWSALVAAFNEGTGKLAGITLTDDASLTLTEAQQTEGAAMITALLADETIVTAG